jgi:hypothetical protein
MKTTAETNQGSGGAGQVRKPDRLPALTGIIVMVLSFVAANVGRAQVLPINQVGYMNVEVPPGYSMLSTSIMSPLGAKLTDVVHSGGQNCMSLTKVDEHGRLQTTFYTPGLGWSDTSITLLPGEGCVVWNPGEASFVVTFVGRVLDGKLTNDLPSGLSMCGPLLPMPGGLSTVHLFPAANNDAVHFLRPDGTYDTYRYQGGTWTPTEPVIGVGRAMWVEKATPTKWIRDFFWGADELGYYLKVYAASEDISRTNLHKSMPSLPPMPGRVYGVAARKAAIHAGLVNAVPATFRWERNGIPLIDAGRIAGAQTGTLILDDLRMGEDEGVYSVLVTNAAGTVKAHVAELQIVPPVTQQPKLNAPAAPTTTGFNQSIQVESGRLYMIQASDDLQTWIEVTNFVSASTTASFVDSGATNYQRRFYRVVSP